MVVARAKNGKAPARKAVRKQTEARLPCPLCNRSFLSTFLEVHAASCDGCTSSASSRGSPSAPTEPQFDFERIGLAVYEDFLSLEEEMELLSAIEKDLPTWRRSAFSGVYHGQTWGAVMNYADRSVSSASKPLPAYLDFVMNKLYAVPELRDCVLSRSGAKGRWHVTEANGIEYLRERGDHLRPHVDDRWLSHGPIVNLCLCGRASMVYEMEADKREKERRKAPGQRMPEVVEVELPRRALQVMKGRARYDYTHAIPNENLLDGRRISITFRCSPVTEPEGAAKS